MHVRREPEVPERRHRIVAGRQLRQELAPGKLVVDETVRGRRVGTRIVRAAEIVLRRQGRRRVAVGVDLGNAGAVRLYLRLGYREWAWGLLDTVREHAGEAGKVIVVPDVCRVFVKNL